MQEIKQYLKDSGEQFDSEIALGTGLTLAQVKVRLAELSAKGEIIMCHSIQFRDGERIEGAPAAIALRIVGAAHHLGADEIGQRIGIAQGGFPRQFQKAGLLGLQFLPRGTGGKGQQGEEREGSRRRHHTPGAAAAIGLCTPE